jgi:hypothetical protein
MGSTLASLAGTRLEAISPLVRRDHNGLTEIRKEIDMAQGRKAKGRRAQRNGADAGESRSDTMRGNGRTTRSEMMRGNGRNTRPEQMVVWADVTQNAMRDFVSMWSDAAQESLRLATELQQAQVDAARDLGRIFTQSAERMRRVA